MKGNYNTKNISVKIVGYISQMIDDDYKDGAVFLSKKHFIHFRTDFNEMIKQKPVDNEIVKQLKKDTAKNLYTMFQQLIPALCELKSLNEIQQYYSFDFFSDRTLAIEGFSDHAKGIHKDHYKKIIDFLNPTNLQKNFLINKAIENKNTDLFDYLICVYDFQSIADNLNGYHVALISNSDKFLQKIQANNNFSNQYLELKTLGFQHQEHIKNLFSDHSNVDREQSEFAVSNHHAILDPKIHNTKVSTRQQPYRAKYIPSFFLIINHFSQDKSQCWETIKGTIDIKKKDDLGNNILHYLLSKNIVKANKSVYLEILKMAIENGLDKDKNYLGKTPIFYAKMQHEQILALSAEKVSFSERDARNIKVQDYFFKLYKNKGEHGELFRQAIEKDNILSGLSQNQKKSKMKLL